MDKKRNNLTNITSNELSKKLNLKKDKNPLNKQKSTKEDKKIKKENKIMDSRKIPDILLKKSSIENKVLNIESSNNSHNINISKLYTKTELKKDINNDRITKENSKKLIEINNIFRNNKYKLLTNDVERFIFDIKEKNNDDINKTMDENKKERIESKEKFSTILLRKKMKLFSLTNEKNQNDKSINFKNSYFENISSENIKNDIQEKNKNTFESDIIHSMTQKKIIKIKKLGNKREKILYKKLYLNLDKNDICEENKNENKESVKYGTKINKNREIIFNSNKFQIDHENESKSLDKNNINNKLSINKKVENSKNKDQKKETIFINKSSNFKKNNNINRSKKINILKAINNKLNNSDSNLIKKEMEIQKENKNKSELNCDKDDIIKKIKNPIIININIDDSNFNFNDTINGKNNDINISSLKTEILDNRETNPFSTLRIQDNSKLNKKLNLTTKIKENNKNNNKERKNIAISQNIRKNNTLDSKIEIGNITEKIENQAVKSNKNLIFPVNIEETKGNFRKKTLNRLLRKNHYQSLFPEPITNYSTSKIIPKNKFRFNERRKNRENGALKIRINASNKNYFDLYEKAFNDSLSEQKFSFRPKMNKKYFDNDNNNEDNNDEKLNKQKKNDIFFNQKDENKSQKNKIDLEIDDNNKYFILDLNNFIPIDKNELINTFNKPLFNDKI